MEILFKIMYFLVALDPKFQLGMMRDQFLGTGIAESAIFTDTVLLSLLIMGVLSALFYLVLNQFLNLNKIGIWFLFLIIAGAICFQISLLMVGGEGGIYSPSDPIESIGWKFIGMSTVWGMLYFYLFSLLFKRWSKYAKYCPH